MPIDPLIGGSLISAAGGVISGLFGNINTDKTLSAQAKENALTREHNLKLAQLQNQWNIEQWNRENAYNSPAAQMARFKAAGLNPNLIYGQSNTSAQLSGSLTSGSPATPQDISPMLAKKSILSKVFDSIGESMMKIPLYREQVRGAKLQNDKVELENDQLASEKELRDFLKRVNFSPDAIDEYLNDPVWQASLSHMNRYEVQKILFELRHKEASAQRENLRRFVEQLTYQEEGQALRAKYQLDEKEYKEMLNVVADIVSARGSEARKLSRSSDVITLQEAMSKDGLSFKEALRAFFTFALDNIDLLGKIK